MAEVAIYLNVHSDKAIRELKQFARRSNSAFAKASGGAKKFGHASHSSFAHAQHGSRGLIGSIFSLQGAFLGLMAAGMIGGVVKKIADVETSMLGVQKTTNMTDRSIEELRKGFRTLTLEIPMSVTSLGDIGRVAGQLGIRGKKDILEFTRVIAKVATVTDWTAEEAAYSLAKLGNLFDLPVSAVKRLAATMNQLENTTTANVISLGDFMKRIAPAGTQLNMTAADVAGLSATLVDLGFRAELGGTAVNNTLTRMVSKADVFAKQMGISVSDFRTRLQKDAIGTVVAWGESIQKLPLEQFVTQMNDAGIEGARARMVFTSLAKKTDLLRKNVKAANDEWARGTSLQKEFAVMAKSFWNQLILLKNKIAAVTMEIAVELLPTGKRLIKQIGRDLEPKLKSLKTWFDKNKTAIDTMVKEGYYKFRTAAGLTLKAVSALTGVIKNSIEVADKYQVSLAILGTTLGGLWGVAKIRVYYMALAGVIAQLGPAGLLGASLAVGYAIGTWLRKFEIVRDAGDIMVKGILVGFTNLKFEAYKVFTGIKDVSVGAFKSMKYEAYKVLTWLKDNLKKTMEMLSMVDFTSPRHSWKMLSEAWGSFNMPLEDSVQLLKQIEADQKKAAEATEKNLFGSSKLLTKIEADQKEALAAIESNFAGVGKGFAGLNYQIEETDKKLEKLTKKLKAGLPPKTPAPIDAGREPIAAPDLFTKKIIAELTAYGKKYAAWRRKSVELNAEIIRRQEADHQTYIVGRLQRQKGLIQKEIAEEGIGAKEKSLLVSRYTDILTKEYDERLRLLRYNKKRELKQVGLGEGAKAAIINKYHDKEKELMATKADEHSALIESMKKDVSKYADYNNAALLRMLDDARVYGADREDIQRELSTRLTEQHLSVSEAFKLGLKSDTAYFKTTSQTMMELGHDTYKTLTAGFKNVFSKVIRGEFKSIGSAFKSLMNSMVDLFVGALAQMAAQSLANSVVSGVSNFIGSLSIGSDRISSDGTARLHKGEAVITAQDNNLLKTATGAFGREGIKTLIRKVSGLENQFPIARHVLSAAQSAKYGVTQEFGSYSDLFAKHAADNLKVMSVIKDGPAIIKDTSTGEIAAVGDMKISWGQTLANIGTSVAASLIGSQINKMLGFTSTEAGIGQMAGGFAGGIAGAALSAAGNLIAPGIGIIAGMVIGGGIGQIFGGPKLHAGERTTKKLFERVMGDYPRPDRDIPLALVRMALPREGGDSVGDAINAIGRNLLPGTSYARSRDIDNLTITGLQKIVDRELVPLSELRQNPIFTSDLFHKGLKIHEYADGGIIDRPTLSMIGEAGAEAVIPLKHGRVEAIVKNTSAKSEQGDGKSTRLAERMVVALEQLVDQGGGDLHVQVVTHSGEEIEAISWDGTNRRLAMGQKFAVQA